MRPDWNLHGKPDIQSHTGEQWKKDSASQERRELTFWMQEAAYSIHVLLVNILSVDDISDPKDKLILANIMAGARSAIITGAPITDPWQRVEHVIGGISMNNTATLAEKKTELILFEFAERLDILGYNVKTVQFPLTPCDQPYTKLIQLASIGCTGKNYLPHIHEFACRVNLGIIITDAPLFGGDYRYLPYSGYPCKDCRLCVEYCPCGALDGGKFDQQKCTAFREAPENQLRFSPFSVLKCDICMRVCPHGTVGKWDSKAVKWKQLIEEKRINF